MRCRVSITVYRGGQRLAWGDLLVTRSEGCTVFGKLYDIELRPPDRSQPLVVQATAGLVVDHNTDALGAMLVMRLYDLVDTENAVEPVRQVLIFKAATRIPSEYESESDDWLCEAEGHEIFARVQWLPEPPAQTSGRGQANTGGRSDAEQGDTL